MLRLTTLFVLCAALSLPAHAIVNIEAMRLTPEPGFSGSVETAISGKRGTAESDTVNAALRADWHQGPHTAFVIAEREYGKTNDVRSADSVFVHAREIYALTDTFALEAYAQRESDDFLRLKSRVLAGLGGRLHLWERPETANLYVGLGAFAFREETESVDPNDDGKDEGVRMNAYINYTHRLADNLRIMSTTYYQPRTGDLADVRALEQAALAVDITRRLELKLTLDLVHDSDPPEGIEQNEVSYQTRFRFSF